MSTKSDIALEIKIATLVIVAVAGFASFSYYSYNTAVENKNRLNNIQSISFPVLERTDKLIVLLERIRESFEKAVVTADIDLVDSADSMLENSLSLFGEMESIEPEIASDLSSLKDQQDAFYQLSKNAVVPFINGESDMTVLMESSKQMNASYGEVSEKIKQFREVNYKKFTDTIEISNKEADKMIIIGMVVGVVMLLFILSLAFFIRKNIKMMSIIQEHNENLELKIAERTAVLQQKTADIQCMLKNMQQGIFTVVDDNKIHPEYSAFLETMLGTENIADRDVMDLLFTGSNIGPDQANQVQECLKASIGEPIEQYEWNAHLLVEEVVMEASTTEAGEELDERIINLDWVPIGNAEEDVEKVMVIGRDVTEVRRLHYEAEKQKRELNIIGQILDVSVKQFEAFVETGNDYLDANSKLIAEHATKDLPTLDALFRNMHTIKGNARTYGLKYLTDVVHQAEQFYDELRKDESLPWDTERMLKDIELVRENIAEYHDIYQEKLSGHGEGDAGESVFLNSIKELVADIADAPDADKVQFVDSLGDLIAMREARPLHDLIKPIEKSIESIALETGKCSPKMSIEGGDALMAPATHNTLNDVLTHCLRNSVDHGLESTEKRQAKGKADSGTISVYATTSDSGIRIRLFDDGAGLNLPGLRQKGIDKGLLKADCSDIEAANLIFNSGLSTAQQVSQISGRGVGMDAVRNFLKGLGGSIDIEFTGDTYDDGFRPFQLVLSLPAQCVILPKAAAPKMAQA